MGRILHSLPLLITLLYLWLIRNIPRGSLSDPGPGLYPMVIGSLALIISLFVLISYLKQKEARSEGEKLKLPTLAYVLAFIVTGIVFEILGALIGLLIFILVLFKVSGVIGWRKPVFLSLIFVFCLYGIFYYWFKVPFPQGLLDYFIL